jgi:hydroxypyruvate isomerase
MPRFAANLSMMFNEVPFLDRFRRRGESGFHRRRIPVSLRSSGREVGEAAQAQRPDAGAVQPAAGRLERRRKGFAALPERFDDLKQSLQTALPYAQATGVKRLHLMAGIADRSDHKAVERLQVGGVGGGVLRAARPRRRDRADQLAQRARLFPQRFLFARDLITELKIPNLKLQFDIITARSSMATSPCACANDADHRPRPDRQHSLAQRARR